jgi:hypothetical protein
MREKVGNTKQEIDLESFLCMFVSSLEILNFFFFGRF